MGYRVPILYIPFKRLHIVKQVFPQIKNVKPSKLYIAQDGPRNEDESKMLEEVMSFILENIDWDTELHIFKSDKNNGPNIFIYKAVNWFFENEETGIIIEEDGFPSKSYFEFARVLLAKHKNDEKVYAICGFSGFSKNEDSECDYFYSRFFNPWVFATWRDRWNQFDFELRNIESFDFMNDVYKNEAIVKILMGHVNVIRKDIEWLKDKVTWDLRFRLTIHYNNGFCLVPRQNLIKHLDFGSSNAYGYTQETFLTDIKDYVEIGEYDFNEFIGCSEEYIQDRFLDFTEKDIVFSIASPKVYDRIKNIINNSKKIYIYGVGIFGYALYNAYKDVLIDKLVAFVDDNMRGYILGNKILSYNEIEDGCTILIGMTRTEHIYSITNKLKNYRGNIVVIKDILKEAIQ